MTASIIVYGIPNCDITKKAMTWLKQNNISFVFHDYKKEGINIDKLNSWSAKSSWENLLNKRGTTWKSLESSIQEKITNQVTAVKLMSEHTSLIKRPVLEINNDILIGFDEKLYKNKLLIS